MRDAVKRRVVDAAEVRCQGCSTQHLSAWAAPERDAGQQTHTPKAKVSIPSFRPGLTSLPGSISRAPEPLAKLTSEEQANCRLRQCITWQLVAF